MTFRLLLLPLICLCLCIGLCTVVGAEQAGRESTYPSLPSEYGDMLRELPEALRQSLPQELFSTDAWEAARAWEDMTSLSAILKLIGEAFKGQWKGLLGLALQLVGLLILRAVWQAFASHVSPPSLSWGMPLICRLCLFGLIVTQAVQLLDGVQAFYEDLGQLNGAFLPLMGALYAMGGNVGAAAANQSTLVLTFSLIEWIGGQTVIPLFSLCLSFSLLGVFDTAVAGRMQLVTSKLKKWYTTALAIVMIVLSTVLAAQTTLAARADSLTFRTVRFAVSSSVPLVGGGVADMLRNAASGLTWLRGLVGVGGVVLLVWLLVPHVLRLLAVRWLYSLAEDVAAWMDCREEGRLLGEVRSLYGYLLAVVSVSVLCFLFALLLLLQCGVAYVT